MLIRRPNCRTWTTALLLALCSVGVAQTPPAGGASETPANTRPNIDPSVLGGDVQIADDRLAWHIPDPEPLLPLVEGLLSQAQQSGDSAKVASYTRQLDRLRSARRDTRVSLTLEDVVRKVLANNFTIETARYNPAIEVTRLVEAESAFDAVLYGNLAKNKVDRPSGSQLAATSTDLFDSTIGVRKLLPSGMQVSGSYGFRRTQTSLSFQQINPEYFSNFEFAMRQPFLRGFGLDYNRSLISMARAERQVSEFTLERQIRDTLRQAEEAYWRLVQARRNLVVTLRLLADFETIYDYVVSRKDFDMTPVQIAATKANLEQSRAEYVTVRAAVRDAQDRLLAIMNDPELNLSRDIEIIPASFPSLTRFEMDRLGEIQTALEARPEIREQELRIDIAKIQIGRARNAELPRFDMTFRYTIDGLGPNADASFDDALSHDFVEYYIGVELEMPIGNRGPRAASRRARLQHAQAAAQLKSLFEQVILDVNLAVRQVSTSFDQIAPSFEAAEAREREVESTVARAERKDLNTLNSELGARQGLAAARRAMVAAMVEYNIAIIDLERAKGTLLEYNGVSIPTSEE